MVICHDNFIKNDCIKNRTELLAALIIDNNIYKDKELFVGHPTHESLPDIFDEDKEKGFEVVTLEKDIDQIKDSVFYELSKVNFGKEKFKYKKKTFDKKGVIFEEKNEKIFIKNTFDCHLENWMDEDIKNMLNKKLKKLNNGNYNGCKDISLIILSIDRYRTKDFAISVFDFYNNIKKEYSFNFKNVYLVLSNKIYHFYYENIKEYEYDENIIINKMKSMFEENK